jgi:hypothetical protein
VPSFAGAIEALGRDRFHAIFIDANAPDLIPTELDKLRVASPGTPRTVIGAPDMEAHVDEMSEVVELRFVLNTLTPAQLEAEVRRVLFPRSTAGRVSFERTPWRVQGTFEGRPFDHRLMDLSNRGLSLGIEPGAYFENFVPGSLLRDLKITDPQGGDLFGLVGATVRHVQMEKTSGGPLVRVGLSIDAPVPQRPPHIRVFEEMLPIVSSLRKAARAGASFTLALPDAESGFRFESGVVTDGSEAVLLLSGAAPAGWRAHDAVRLTFSHHGLSYSALTSIISLEGGVRVAIPRTMRVHHRRSSNRHRPNEGRSYSVRVSSPLTGRTQTFPIHDLNSNGLSFVMDSEADLYPVGLVVDPLEITLSIGGAPIVARGVVRSVASLSRSSADEDRAPARCGIELLSLTEADRVRFSQCLIADGFPHVETANESDFDEIWQLFKDAGFTFHLYGDGSPESTAVVRSGFGQALKHGRPLATSLLFKSEGKIRGHVSAIQTYSKTAMLTHLAVLQGPSAPADRITRAICLSIGEYAEQQPDIEFVRLNWNRDSPWPNRMYGWSGRAIHTPGLSVAREFGVMVRSNETGLPIPAGVELREATDDDLRIIERHLLENVNLVRIQSEDLTLRTMRLQQLNERYQERGLFRRRHIHVAWLDGVRVGASFLERTTLGLQLAEATNAFDVHCFSSAPPSEQARVRAALIADAVEFYRREGLSYSVSLADLPEQGPFLDAGFRVASISRCWVWHRSQVRRFADVWDQLTLRGREIFGPRRGH